MSEELIISAPQAAIIKCERGNYTITAPSGGAVELKRDRDFGNPKKKDGTPVFPQPILFKGGAEQIIRNYRMMDRYVVESSTEDAENGYFYYRVKCSLVAYNPTTGGVS